MNWKGGRPKCSECKVVISYGCKMCIHCARKTLLGSRAPHWKKCIGYRGIHKWICEKFNKPDLCQLCNNPPRKRLEWANITGVYTRDIANYLCLCVPCHRRLDLKIRARNIYV